MSDLGLVWTGVVAEAKAVASVAVSIGRAGVELSGFQYLSLGPHITWKLLSLLLWSESGVGR